MSEKNSPGAVKRSVFDRALSLVTVVRPGEGVAALLLALNVFLLLTAYYVIKPVREALILATGGAEVKSYASVGQALLLALAVPLYGYIASRLSRRALITRVTLFFVGCLCAFFAAAVLELPHLGVAFYLFVGIFNLMVIAQFWSFANDIYSPEQGERLFPVVAFGASIGAVSGSLLTGALVKFMSVEQLLLVSAAILGVTIFIARRVDSMNEGATPEAPPMDEEAPRVNEGGAADSEPKRGAFGLVLRSPYLLLIAGLMFLANLVNTTGEFILGSLVSDTARTLVAEGASGGLDEKQWIGSFYADFFAVVNVAGVLFQLFLVSRVIRWFGVRGAVLFLPLIALGSYVLLAIAPVLAIVRWAKTAENSTDYSLNNTVRNILFLPLSRDEKYQAKQAIDGFFVRGGDVASAAVVYAGLNLLSWKNQNFAWFNVAMVVLWVLCAVFVGKRYAQLTGRTPDEQD